MPGVRLFDRPCRLLCRLQWRQHSGLAVTPSAPWKGSVRVFPQTTSVKDLKENYLLAKDGGFYLDHRLIVREYPQSYTIEPLSTRGTGGVDPVTGRKAFPRIGGGLKKYWLWADMKRYGPTDSVDNPLVEKVCKIVDSQCHSAKLALVGHGHQLRYIIATENMKPGDLIRTYGKVPPAPIKPLEGDAWPLAALPTGTPVCCIEPLPGWGARYCVNAGSYAIVQSFGEGRCVLKLVPLKKRSIEISVEQNCMAVVGRVGNVDHHKEQLGSANALRRSGYRPRSGWEQKKTGRCGRKIYPTPPTTIITEELLCPEEPHYITYTWDDFELKP